MKKRRAKAPRTNSGATRNVIDEELDIDTSLMTEEETAALGMNEYPPEEDQDLAIAAVEERTREVIFNAGGAAMIQNDEDYVAAGAFLTEQIKPALAKIETTFRPMQRAADKNKAEIMAQRKRHEEPLLEAEKAVKGSIGAYHQRQQEIAREAERERLADARRAAESKALEEAARLESEGKVDAAEARLEAPVMPIVTTAPVATVPKAAGIAVKTKTCYRITDPAKITTAYLMPDTKKIRQIVSSFGADAAEMVGGIEVYEEPVVAAGRR